MNNQETIRMPDGSGYIIGNEAFENSIEKLYEKNPKLRERQAYWSAWLKKPLNSNVDPIMDGLAAQTNYQRKLAGGR